MPYLSGIENDFILGDLQVFREFDISHFISNAKSAISGKELNYVYMTLTNSLAGKNAVVEIPAKISETEFNELVKFSKIFSALGVETSALISSFDPTKEAGGPDFNTSKYEISDVSLEKALSYLNNKSNAVVSDINLANVYGKENLYRYEMEEMVTAKTR